MAEKLELNCLNDLFIGLLIKYIMGNINELPQYEDMRQWRVIAHRRNYSVIRNINSNQELQKNIITYDHSQSYIESQLKIYETRKDNNTYWVRCLYYFQDSQQIFCRAISVYNIITQRIARLTDIRKLENQSAEKYFKQALTAYHSLSQRFGGFSINSCMLGLSKEKQVKVWINQNFGLNQRQYPCPLDFNQEAAIRDIHKMLADRVNNSNFKDILETQKTKITFQNTLKHLQGYKRSKSINKSFEFAKKNSLQKNSEVVEKRQNFKSIDKCTQPYYSQTQINTDSTRRFVSKCSLQMKDTTNTNLIQRTRDPKQKYERIIDNHQKKYTSVELTKPPKNPIFELKQQKLTSLKDNREQLYRKISLRRQIAKPQINKIKIINVDSIIVRENKQDCPDTDAHDKRVVMIESTIIRGMEGN